MHQSQFREKESHEEEAVLAVDFLPDEDENSARNCDDSEACHADIGFMFDSENDTLMRSFSFSPNTMSGEESGMTINVQVQSIDDDPGAVQSGHYLWPAAPVLAQHLVDMFGCSSAKEDAERSLVKESVHNVLELGAGCGLASLVAMQIFPDLRQVILTDHDPGTLSLSEENYDATCERLEETDAEIAAKLPLLSFERLGWGEKDDIADILSLITYPDDKSESCNGKGGFDLVLGSDLIYCEDVVSPLIFTVARTLSKSNVGAKMIMTQSFPYESGTEDEISRVCLECNLVRTVLSDKLTGGGIRVQTFHHKL
eukprot:CAMPEP_0194370044 /NCGR_PEP_ID=MMETSP0174-20130528/18392_1 /TAXON_ID=216777 /ORGANISM="Proboscia alata, Strain PI-D3" /LENGTH=312 /DNA_ID=CAMNT_0039147327 /DNA_START=15 /DNA_END=953 /DNA_ORIENTATION=-